MMLHRMLVFRLAVEPGRGCWEGRRDAEHCAMLRGLSRPSRLKSKALQPLLPPPPLTPLPPPLLLPPPPAGNLGELCHALPGWLRLLR